MAIGTNKDVVPNLVFFSFRDFASHNMGQLDIDWRKKADNSLACNPVTRFAALDSLQTIVTEFQNVFSNALGKKLNDVARR